MRLTRRGLLASLPAGLLLPRVLAAPPTSERKFLFLTCTGGWDPAWALAPIGGGLVVGPEGAEPGEAGGIPFVENPASPSVRDFLQTYGARTCFVHGIEARSVTHDVCLRLTYTGTSNPSGDDWASRVARASARELVMPFLHVSGPTFAYTLGDQVVRVGEQGQLQELLTGEALGSSDLPTSPPGARSAAAQDAFLRARLAEVAASAGRGRAREIADLAAAAHDRRAELIGLAEDLDLSGGDSLAERAGVMAECFSRGLSRCAMMDYAGFLGASWDTHATNETQGDNFETLFNQLGRICADLDGRRGEAGGSLAEEVTIVVLSEMGRYPTLNSRQGKDHWTWTTAMLIGAGVRGGRAIGGYAEDDYTGLPVDLATGEVSDTGVQLSPTNLGATLLALAGADPGEVGEPIEGVLA